MLHIIMSSTMNKYDKQKRATRPQVSIQYVLLFNNNAICNINDIYSTSSNIYCTTALKKSRR